MSENVKSAWIGGICGIFGILVGLAGSAYVEKLYRPSEWSGVWKTRTGFTGSHPYTFRLKQHGTDVGGTYTGLSGTPSEGIEGILYGQVAGSTLRGIWQRIDQDTEPGTFVLTLQSDGNEFAGSYKDGPTNGKWHGER